jgi:hypothetical protein
VLNKNEKVFIELPVPEWYSHQFRLAEPIKVIDG